LTHALSLAAAGVAAGRWFQQSGIQDASGGVARYYFAETGQNRAISTEITGYAASALVFLADVTNDESYLRTAQLAVDFLCEEAWEPAPGVFPFELDPEPDSHLHTYFFDTGIIIRGLLAVWRVTKENRLLRVAKEAARQMARHFAGPGDWHPVLQMPSLRPTPREARWSRSPGCYQLKSALGWLEVADATGDESIAAPYYEWMEKSLASHRDYLPGSDDPSVVMDRLHPYCYFLEGMSRFVSRVDCRDEYAWGLERAGKLLREIRPVFLRADVCAQLLRARLLAAEHIPLDIRAASEEAGELLAFQAQGEDPRIDGGFWFGRRNGEVIPHVSPVPTAFAVQALELWRAFQAGEELCHKPVI
jgi:hypothetical protein